MHLSNFPGSMLIWGAYTNYFGGLFQGLLLFEGLCLLGSLEYPLVQVEVIVNNEIGIFVIFHCFSVKYPLDVSLRVL